MKQFTEFVRKEFIHIFRDRQTMLILLVMPIILIILFGFAITTEVKCTRVGVLDLSKDEVTENIIQHFSQNKYFQIAHNLSSAKEIDGLFKSGDIDMVLCFSQDFSTEVVRGNAKVQMLFDGIEPNQASIRSGYAQGILMSCQQELMQKRMTKQPLQIVPVTKMLYNPQLKSEYNFVPAVIGMIILLLCTLMTSISIVREKEMGTMEILLASPLLPGVIILAKLVPYLVMSIFNLITILILSTFLLGVPIAGNLLTLFGISLLYILVSLALGLFISTCVNTQLAAMLLSLLMIVPTVYFSGMVFPIESMPAAIQNVSVIVPTRWFIDASRKIMIQGVESIYIVKDAIVLGVMLIILLTVALKLFKTRLE